MKNKTTTILIILATLVLAGVAIFTAIRLYQLRQQPVAPNVPSSRPAAAEPTSSPVTQNACVLNFSLATATPTPTITATATATATPTVTATATVTPVAQCNSSCTTNSQCPNNLTCYISSGSSTGNCRNASCTGESDCLCATATATATAKPTSTATAPSLPNSGSSWPTIFAAGLGILVVIGGLLLAL